MDHARTSKSHPLYIDAVKPPFGTGRIGMTICPGKQGDSIMGGQWTRDLDCDLSAIRAWGADILVSLMEDHEFELLAVPDLLQEASNHGLTSLHLPIQDVSIPDQAWIDNWKQSTGPELRQALLEGKLLALHCRGGLGRTGLVAALLLIDLGCDQQTAIDQVRAARMGTIETNQQEEFVLSYLSWTGRQSLDHYAGCLLGGALGDALGWPVEFSHWDEIQEMFGETGISEPQLNRQGVLEITDDTQMSLFTAEGLILGHNSGAGMDIESLVNSGHRAYLRWLHTQEQYDAEADSSPLGEGWLLNNRALYAERAPGASCTGALSSGAMGSIGDPINNSKGCGTVMRVAPVGLFAKSPVACKELVDEEVDTLTFRLGCEYSAITHGHPSGYIAGGFMALLIARLIDGDTLAQALDCGEKELTKWPGHEECLNAIRAARALANNKAIPPSADAIATLGEGWVAEEALAIGIYCSLCYPTDFTKAVLMAVNHSGDSDSTGAITGNILGAILGTKGIPKAWLENLELHSCIESMAMSLFSLCPTR